MCLGVPGQVVRFVSADVIECDFWGVTRDVRLDQLEATVAVGDYILEHEGYAVRRIDDEVIAETLELYETVLIEA